MKRHTKLKCISTESKYLTTGKTYTITSGKGDFGDFGEVFGEFAFELIDDEGGVIFQSRLDGLHGDFEVTK